MTERETEMVEALIEDGDKFVVDETHVLRLVIDHDDDASINDYEGDGKVSHYVEYRRAEYRPEGFTGRARKIDVDRSGCVWWEPYDGPMGWQADDGTWLAAKWEQLPTAEQRKQISRITRLIQDGFYTVTLQLRELVQDSLGHEHWVELASASLSAVDTVGPEYLPDVLLDLAVELPVSLA